MNCLALDTAGPFCSAAVLVDDVLTVESERINRGHAEFLVPMIDRLIARAGLRYGDLDRVGVTVGPGSFTGVRVGLAAARGFGFALDVEVLGFGVLDVLVEETGTPDACAVMHTRSGTVFALPAGASAAKESTLDDLAGRLDGGAGEPALIGSAAPALASRLGRGHVVRAAEAVDIECLAFLTRSGRGAGLPRPLYLRPPDARLPARQRLVRRSG